MSGDIPPDTSSVQYRRWGIYTVAYDKPPGCALSFCPKFSRLAKVLREDALPAGRLISQLFGMAPVAISIHALCTLWMSIAPGLWFYLSGIILITMEAKIMGVDVDQRNLQIAVVFLLLSVIVSNVVERILDEVQLILRAHLRSHFLPQLAEASLRQDVLSIKDTRICTALPDPGRFEETAPGWDFVEQFFWMIRHTLAIALQLAVFVVVFASRPRPDKELLTVLCAGVPAAMLISPSNGAEGAPYMFWTDNQHFKRLKALHFLNFSSQHRQDLETDGTTGRSLREYKSASQKVGIVKDSAFHLVHYFKAPWYWSALQELLVEIPVVVYAITLPWSHAPSSLASMALLQYASASLRRNIVVSGCVQGCFFETLSEPRLLYRTLAREGRVRSGSDRYPNQKTSSVKGMKVSFRNVSFLYPEQTEAALDNVTFEIQPGQLVVVVGVNGSGKSSMLNLLPRLFDPTSGEILVDSIPLPAYNTDNLRRFMAVLPQGQSVYPLSLRENIQFGLASDEDVGQDKVDNAARLGGSYEFIQALPLGFDTNLSMIQTGWNSNTPGAVSETIMREAAPHIGRQIPITAGQKQRLAASRTFMRLDNSDIKLLIVDEPTSALDPIAEDALFTRLRQRREGKTVIFVTHRFGGLVKHADLILCMKEGKIVEQGTHDQLLRKDGEYARLYRPQAAGYS